MKGNLGYVFVFVLVFIRCAHFYGSSHLEITSFLASLCKVCWMIQNRLILPTANVAELNPSIKWAEYNLRVPTEVEPLGCRSVSGRPLIAMTSSGIGGANGHCVIQGPPATPTLEKFWITETDIPVLLIASGLTPRSASAVAEELHNLEYLDALRVERNYGRRARSLTWRSFAVKAIDRKSTFSEPIIIPKTAPPLVFVFSGQGPQHYDS